MIVPETTTTAEKELLCFIIQLNFFDEQILFSVNKMHSPKMGLYV